MSKDNQLAVNEPQAALATDRLSAALGIPRDVMIDTIKKQCFRNAKEEITNAQLAAFISIANDMGVNPLLPGMLYAYPSQGAIFPIMGPDGVFKKLAENPTIDSWETTVYPEDVAEAPTHATTKIWRKGSERPLAYTALMSEWKVNSNPNWSSRPRHMLGLRSLKHAARMVIHGIPGDEDDRVLAEINVTPRGESSETVKRDTPPPRAPSGVAASKQKEKALEVEIVPNHLIPEKVVTALADKETRDFICRVVSFTADIVNTKDGSFPSVKAVVDGDFSGTVYHLGGATQPNPGTLVAGPAWFSKTPVKLTLTGKAVAPKKNEDGTTTPRPCAIMCSAIEPVTQTAPAEQGTSEVE